jgi:hypothetical protein
LPTQVHQPKPYSLVHYRWCFYSSYWASEKW